jgi:hypothetical protein
MITSLPERILALPHAARAVCERIFSVRREHGRALPPLTMETWVREQFGTLEAVREQTIIRVTNRLTLESALINPLRALRMAGNGIDDIALERWIASELEGGDFADPLQRTPADVFGRITGQYCVSASNVAKYDGWHGLVVFGEGNPLRFAREHLADYLDVACCWIETVHAHDPQALYPVITWNCLPKSGASIVHGHMQVAVARGMPYARPEVWRRAAEAYAAGVPGGREADFVRNPGERSTLRDYVGDLFEVHRALGLVLHNEGGIRSFAHLAPLRNHEVVLFATENPESTEREMTTPAAVTSAARKLAEPLYAVVRGLIDWQGVRALNLGIVLPPLGPAEEDWRGFPVIARVCDRGAPLTFRNDWAAMELYGSPVITTDPFETAAALRDVLQR